MQQAIGCQHRRQRHLGKVHALGQHLGTDQDVRLAGGEAIQQAAMPITAAGGVAVEAKQPQPIQFPSEQLHDLLGPSTEGLEGSGSAMGAAVADLIAVITPVTAQPLTTAGAAVDGERHITVRAHHHLPTATAPQKGAVAPSRHQDHGLFPLLR